MQKKKRWLIPAVIIGILVLFCVVTYIVTPLVIVRPNYNEKAAEELTLIEMQELYAEKQALNIPLVEDIKIETPDGNLYGWRLHQMNNTYSGEADLLLYFGGYDEDSSTAALRFLDQMTETEHFKAYDIAVVDFPGFGTSSGKATDEAIRTASAAIYNYFRTRDNVRNIYVMGYSFGCGPAAYVASLYDVSGLILLAPYESIYDLYNSVTPVFYGPMRLLISFQMDTGVYAEKVKCAPLIIASRADERIPYRCSLALSEHFSEDAQFITIRETTHGDLTTDVKVLEAISLYLNAAN
ncbi:MAG: alpha/beta fold hydrolase [Lachnospiraceae bacterium]|nr:alpha/beta fold hydrolase [Lachnospiraceae bacterium]